MRHTSPTEGIHAEWWPAGETVTIKAFLNGWEGLQLRAAFRRLKAADDAREGGPDAEMLSYEQALCMLQHGVISLTLLSPYGQPVALTLDGYKGLMAEDVNYIASEFGRLLNLWSRTPAPSAATQEEADAAGFQPPAAGGPDHAEGDPGQTDSGGDAGGAGGGPETATVPGALGDAPVDLPQPA